MYRDDSEIIVTVARTPDGIRARDDLIEQRHPFPMTYVTSLSERLAGGELSRNIVSELEYDFVLMRVEGDLDDIIERLLAWFDSRDVVPNSDGRLQFTGHGRVLAAERNRTMQYGSMQPGSLPAPTTIGAPLAFGGEHWNYLAQMNVGVAHAASTKGVGMKVAVVDSGIDASAIRATAFYDVTTAAGSAVAPVPQADTDGHGTAMAQIVNAVAPGSDLYGVRVISSGEPKLFNTMTGVAVAIFECRANIVSLSLSLAVRGPCPQCGGARESTLTYFIKSMNSLRGSLAAPLIVASTGNAGSSQGFRHPAACDGVLAVGAVNRQSIRSAFSTYGTAKSWYLMAPGGDIDAHGRVVEDVGTGSSGLPCYGTSPACAYAAGMLALLWSTSRYSTLSAADVVDRVLQVHCNMPVNGTATEYGAGVVRYS